MPQLRNFDAAALNWDELPRRVQLGCDVAASIAAAVPLSAQWDALDFGCGTGLVTLQLAPSLRSITGLDSSAGMISRLNEKAEQCGMANVTTELCDLGKGELPSGKYHLITSSMTLHHIPEIVPLLHTLKTFLHPGGWVALADLDAEDGSFHEDTTGVFHHGFSPETFTQMLTSAGFTSIKITTAANIDKGGRTFRVLLATAQAS